MPQRKPTPDDYWSTPDKEMVALGGCFQYVSGLCCGYTKPNSFVSTVRNTSRTMRAINSGTMVYANQYNTVVYPTQTVSTSTTGNTSVELYNLWQNRYRN